MLTILINAVKKQYCKHRDSITAKRKAEKAIREKVERLTVMLTKMDDSISSLSVDVDAARVDITKPAYSRSNTNSSLDVVYAHRSNWNLIVRLFGELPDNKPRAVYSKDNTKTIAILYHVAILYRNVSGRYHDNHGVYITPLIEAIHEESLPKKRSLYY